MMGWERNLARAIESHTQPPCEAFNCPRINDCRRFPLACQAFYVYLRSGRVFEPTAMFDLNGRLRGYTCQPPMASRAMYALCYPERDSD